MRLALLAAACAFVAVSTAGCDSGRSDDEPTMTATLNGAAWSATATILPYSSPETQEEGFDIDGIVGDPREVCPAPDHCEAISLGYFSESVEPGQYDRERLNYFVLDGDLIVEQYEQADGPNWVELTAIAEREVSGRFEATFVNRNDPADTLRFRNGSFTARPFSEIFPGSPR